MNISVGGSGGDGGVTLATSHNNTTGDDREVEGEEDKASETVVIVDIPVDGLKVGLSFEGEDVATESILQWGRKTWCPLIRVERFS